MHSQYKKTIHKGDLVIFGYQVDNEHTISALGILRRLKSSSRKKYSSLLSNMGFIENGSICVVVNTEFDDDSLIDCYEVTSGEVHAIVEGFNLKILENGQGTPGDDVREEEFNQLLIKVRRTEFINSIKQKIADLETTDLKTPDQPFEKYEILKILARQSGFLDDE